MPTPTNIELANASLGFFATVRRYSSSVLPTLAKTSARSKTRHRGPHDTRRPVRHLPCSRPSVRRPGSRARPKDPGGAAAKRVAWVILALTTSAQGNRGRRPRSACQNTPLLDPNPGQMTPYPASPRSDRLLDSPNPPGKSDDETIQTSAAVQRMYLQ